MYSDNKYYLWTPLVGFDMNKEDRGVDEYFSKMLSKPAGISLFVFNADMVNLHKGMGEEYLFPTDYCNYYGSVRNELRSVQPWTNYKFKELVQNIKKKGVETYLSIMGMHTIPRDRVYLKGYFGFIGNQDFLVENEEVCNENTAWTGHTCILKRLKDGTYFEDYFLNKTLKTLIDYDADGIHLADEFFPTSTQLQRGDMSFDMIEQFASYSKLKLPEGLTCYIKGNKFADIKERANYIWNNLRFEWIKFYVWRYKRFLTKLCDGLHAHGKKVMVNNSWMSDAFESLYRYGLDYKSFSDAGVDVVLQEQQAGIILANKPDCEYMADEHYCKNMIMKAYAGDTKCLTITFAKDSTEAASMITHMPSLCESEQLQLANYYIYENGSYKRTIDGYIVDLADALSDSEWEWLIKRYEKIFADERFSPIAPTLVWHDDFMGDEFLKDYIKTRRWSTHRYIAYLNKYNAGIRAVCKFKDIEQVKNDLFVPNVDLLKNSDIEKIKSYKNGIVVVTLSKQNDNLEFNGIRFEDENVKNDGNRTVCYVLNANQTYHDEIRLVTEIEDDSPDIDFDKPITDTFEWTKAIVFRKISTGFLSAIAKILKKASVVRHGVILEGDKDYTIVKTENGAKRLIYPNKDLAHYNKTQVTIKGKFSRVINKMDFPATPFKVISEDKQLVTDLNVKKIAGDTVNFILKVAPGGIAVVDIFE